MNTKIKDIVNKIILMLKEKYPELETLNRFNNSLKIHELVINDNKNYSTNDEFDDLLYELLEKYVYSNKLHVYCYYLQENEFEELKKEEILFTNKIHIQEIYLNIFKEIIKYDKEYPLSPIDFKFDISENKSVEVKEVITISDSKFNEKDIELNVSWEGTNYNEETIYN
jgi:hypothetical protein